MRNILFMHWVKLLKQRREACGLTQTELAVQAGVSLPSIQKMEAGRANPSLKTLQSVFTIIGVDVEFTMRSAKTEKAKEKESERKKEGGRANEKVAQAPQVQESIPAKAKPTGLLKTVSHELNGLTKGPARERVNHLFKLLDKITDPDRRPAN